MDVDSGSTLFRLLGDPARLRLLRVLGRDRFNVSELTAILGLAQSGVSRHLGLLKQAGLVEEDRDGGFVYYHLAAAARADGGPLGRLLEEQFAADAATSLLRQDTARLQEVLRLRRENFDAHAGPDTRDGRQLVPGRSWAAWSRALAHLLPPLEVADLGCGEGYLTIEIARWAHHVTAIDRSPAVLERARALAHRRHATNITWKKGDLQAVPLPEASVDVVLFSQALHHAPDPSCALGEAARILRPGGRLLLLDLREHDEQWVRVRFGDVHLGFSDAALRALLEGAGFEHVRTQVGARISGDPFTVLVASGVRGERGRVTAGQRRSTVRSSGGATARPRRSARSRSRSRPQPVEPSSLAVASSNRRTVDHP